MDSNNNNFIELKFPMEGVLPLGLLIQSETGFFSNLKHELFKTPLQTEIINSKLTDLFTPTNRRGTIPKIDKPKRLPNSKGFKILNFEGNISYNFTILKTVNSTALTGISNNKKVLFEYENFEQVSIDNYFYLNKYLKIATSSVENIRSPETINSLKNGQIFIITDILQSNKFRTIIIDGSKFNYEINLEIEQNATQLENIAKLQREGEEIKFYNDDKPLTIALRAARILYNMDEDYFYIKRVPVLVRGDNNDSTQVNKWADEFLTCENNFFSFEDF